MSKQSEAKHTPGPWVASDKHSDSEYPWRIESDAGGYPNDGYIIAKLDGPDAEANSLIIAAAPELLESLEQTCGIIDNMIAEGYGSEEAKYARELALAAISKARATND